jgi:hypothetical protein
LSFGLNTYRPSLLVGTTQVRLKHEDRYFTYDLKISRRQQQRKFDPTANAELVTKFHVALHASHADLPMVTLKISPYTNVSLTSGWITLFMGDMGEGALLREERK